MTDRNTARFAEAVTPSDSANLSRRTAGIYVGSTGNLTVVMDGDKGVVTFVGIAAGLIHPIECTRVNSTGTTASDLLAVFDDDLPFT